MAELQIILDAIQDMRDSHRECMESVRNEMQTGLRSSAIQIKAEMDVVNLQLKGLNEKVSKQNGDVAALKAESLKREEAVRDFRTLEKQVNTVKKNLRSKWTLWLLILVLLIIIVTAIYDLGGFPKMFSWLIDKIF